MSLPDVLEVPESSGTKHYKTRCPSCGSVSTRRRLKKQLSIYKEVKSGAVAGRLGLEVTSDDIDRYICKACGETMEEDELVDKTDTERCNSFYYGSEKL